MAATPFPYPMERTLLKRIGDRVLYETPRLHRWVLLHLQHVDKNKLAFLSLITKGQVILDVGANVGGYTRVFSNIVGREGKVIAFEPVPATISTFLKNVNGRDNVELIRMGLGAGELSTKIYTPSGDLGQSSLAKHQGGSWRNPSDVREEEIKLTTLDEFVAKQSIDRIDFIKVDIEGGEAGFLTGAEVTLRQFKPLVYIEINWRWLRDFGTSPQAVSEQFSQLGYGFAYETVIADKHFRFVPAVISEKTDGDFLFATVPLAHSI